MAAGYTSTRPKDDEQRYTLQKLKDRICMIMGGRIAEELCLEDISAGASNDIAKATEIARKMVAEWGMSDKLGFLNYGGEKDEIFIGRDYQQTKNYSEHTAMIIDTEIKKIIDENYKRGVEILKSKRSILDNFAKLLVEKETIYSKEVDMIMSGQNPEEIAKAIDREHLTRKVIDNLVRENSEKDEQLKIQEMKEQTAEALFKSGIISKEEYDAVFKETKGYKDAIMERKNDLTKTLKYVDENGELPDNMKITDEHLKDIPMPEDIEKAFLDGLKAGNNKYCDQIKEKYLEFKSEDEKKKKDREEAFKMVKPADENEKQSKKSAK